MLGEQIHPAGKTAPEQSAVLPAAEKIAAQGFTAAAKLPRLQTGLTHEPLQLAKPAVYSFIASAAGINIEKNAPNALKISSKEAEHKIIGLSTKATDLGDNPKSAVKASVDSMLGLLPNSRTPRAARSGLQVRGTPGSEAPTTGNAGVITNAAPQLRESRLITPPGHSPDSQLPAAAALRITKLKGGEFPVRNTTRPAVMATDQDPLLTVGKSSAGIPVNSQKMSQVSGEILIKRVHVDGFRAFFPELATPNPAKVGAGIDNPCDGTSETTAKLFGMERFGFDDLHRPVTVRAVELNAPPLRAPSKVRIADVHENPTRELSKTSRSVRIEADISYTAVSPDTAPKGSRGKSAKSREDVKPNHTTTAPETVNRKSGETRDVVNAADQANLKLSKTTPKTVQALNGLSGGRGIETAASTRRIENLAQLVEKIRARAQLLKVGSESVFEARLNPANLGSVRVRLAVQGEEMSLAFAAERPEAVSALQEARGDLTGLIASHGYTLSQCDIEGRYPSERWPQSAADADPDRSGERDGQEGGDERNGHEEARDRHIPLHYGYNTMDLVA